MARPNAAVYAQRPDVDEVVVFGRTPEKLATISVTASFVGAWGGLPARLARSGCLG